MNSFFKNLNNFESPTILGPMIILSAMKYPNMKKNKIQKNFGLFRKSKRMIIYLQKSYYTIF